MTDELASLRIEVSDPGMSSVLTRLNDLERQGGRAERATDNLGAGFKRLLGPILGLVSVTAGLKKLLDTAREFEVINASLITATGSAEKASTAMEAIQDLASTTPYALTEVSDAFIKLTNYGLTPSERAILSYGNTASAMGKDLTQLIEAVADAATGEFERLKEFGIKSSKEGDRVSFTFRGVKKEVAFNAQEIEQYLMGLGEVEFAGAMEQRMNTLDGAISNLGDEVDKFFNNISEAGAGEVMTDYIRGAIELIEELNVLLESGAAEAYADAFAVSFSGIQSDIDTTLGLLKSMFSEYEGDAKLAGERGSNFLLDALKNLPENVRALIQATTTEIAVLIDKAEAWADYAKVAFNPFKSDSEVHDAMDVLNKRIKDIDSVREDSIQTIFDEREATIQSAEDQIQKAQELRKQYLENQKLRREQGGDRLEQFGVGGGGQDTALSSAEAKKISSRLDKIRESLMTEEELLRQKHEKELQFLNDSKTAEILADDEKKALLLEKEEEFQKNLRDLREKKLKEEQALVERHEKVVTGFRESAVNNAISLLQVLGRENKAFAYAALAFEKGLAIAQTMINAQVASTAALAPPPVGLGPVAGAALAAKVLAYGKISAGLIAATGIAQAAQMSGGAPSFGSSSGALGMGPQVNTVPGANPGDLSGSSRPTAGLQFIFNGDVNGIDTEQLAETVGNIVKDNIKEKDFVLIEGNTRQAEVLRS